MDDKVKKREFSWTSLFMVLMFIVVTVITLLPFISILLASFRPGREMDYYAKNAIFDPETGGIPRLSSYIFGVHVNF